MQISSFPALLQSLSLYIDMGMARSSFFSGRMFFSSMAPWTSQGSFGAVCPGKFLRSNTAGSPSTQPNSRYSVFQNFTDRGYSFRQDKVPNQKTVHLCCRQLDGSVVQQSCSHPWDCIPINCGHSMFFTDFGPGSTSAKYRIEKLFDLLEVRVLGGT